MNDHVPVRRALLSVSDKTDLVPFARALANRGVELISTGGTARALAEAGIAVTPIEGLTGFPEILDGRVKTLHPLVHGGLLAQRDQPSHLQALQSHGIQPIDLVCVNLYPFAKALRDQEATREELIEMIDIGGPAMIRSAAKNHEFVVVVTTPTQYDRVINELTAHNGATTPELRWDLAAAAFSRTAEYDARIASWMHRRQAAVMPDQFRLNLTKVMDLRYGENPHQQAALYRDPASQGPTIVNAEVLHGKPLGFNNVNDAAAALALIREFDHPAAAIIKHTNPCGAGTAATLHEAFARAYAGDPLAAYGGILALNRPVDAETAAAIVEGEKFFEIVVAPSYAPAALEALCARWKNVRILAVGDQPPTTDRKIEFKSIPGGMLVQDQDLRRSSPTEWRHAAGPAPTEAQREAAALAWTVAKHLKSNAVAIAGEGMVVGAGAGQMDRLTACRIAVEKAGERARGAVAASDAFFPFADGPRILIEAGVSLIVQPGGAKRDEETLALCTERGVTCLLTGIRHFRH